MSINNKCICESPKISLKNTNCENREIELSLLGDGEDKGIILLEDNTTIATFNIKYCPLCGDRLNKEENPFRMCNDPTMSGWICKV